MASIEFILGLAIGLVIYIGQQYRFRQQLKKTLASFSPQEDLAISLPLHSLIRRELNELDRKRKKIRNRWQNLARFNRTSSYRLSTGR